MDVFLTPVVWHYWKPKWAWVPVAACLPPTRTRRQLLCASPSRPAPTHEATVIHVAPSLSHSLAPAICPHTLSHQHAATPLDMTCLAGSLPNSFICPRSVTHTGYRIVVPIRLLGMLGSSSFRSSSPHTQPCKIKPTCMQLGKTTPVLNEEKKLKKSSYPRDRPWRPVSEFPVREIICILKSKVISVTDRGDP
jgi:hypothetical protein